MPPPPPLVPDERQSQTQDSNDEEVEEINREPYEPRMNHSGEINPSIPLPVQQTLYQISQDEVCYHQLYFFAKLPFSIISRFKLLDSFKLHSLE